MHTLKIIIERRWFDEIASGKKTTEYREIKPFWTSRLYDKEGRPRKYDRILFIAGYHPNAPRMETEYLGVTKRDGIYHILIGKILSKKNLKPLSKTSAF